MSKNSSGGFVVTAIVGTAVVATIGGLILFFSFDEGGGIATLEKTDEADILGASDGLKIDRRESLLLKDIEGTLCRLDFSDDHYKILNLNPNPTQKEIDAAYVDLLELCLDVEGARDILDDIYRTLSLREAQIRNTIIPSSSSSTETSHTDIPNSANVFTGRSASNPFTSPTRRSGFPGITTPSTQPTTIENIPSGSTIPNSPTPPTTRPTAPTAGGGTTPVGSSGGSGNEPTQRRTYAAEGGDNDLGNLTVAVAAVLGSFLACYYGGEGSTAGLFGVSVKSSDSTGAAKECGLDVIYSGIARRLATQVASDYITWAAQGFNGEYPLFINDPGEFLTDFTDGLLGDALNTTGFGFLCDLNNFKIDITAILQAKYRRLEITPARCKLSDIVNNIEGLDDALEKSIKDIDPRDLISIEEGSPIVIGENPSSAQDRIDVGNGTVIFNPIKKIFPKGPFDINKKLEKSTKSIRQSIVDLGGRENALQQLATIDSKILQRQREIGSPPSAKDLIWDQHHPESLASFEECSKQENPQQAANCFKVYFSAHSASYNYQEVINRQLDQLTQADELGEVFEAVIAATASGLLKRSIQEGVGSGGVRESAATLVRAGENTRIDSAGDGWAGAVFEDSESGTYAGLYTRIIGALVITEDTVKLFEYIRDNTPIPAPTQTLMVNDRKMKLEDVGYIAFGDGFYKDHDGSAITSLQQDGGLKFYQGLTRTLEIMKSKRMISSGPGQLVPNNSRIRIEEREADTDITRFADPISQIIIGNDPDAGPRDKIKDKVKKALFGGKTKRNKPVILEKTAYVHPADTQNIKNIAKVNISNANIDIVTINRLKSIYESTVSAYVGLVGVRDDYVRGASDNSYRREILSREDSTRKINSGSSPWSVVRDVAIQELQNETAKVFVKSGNQDSLTFLYQCSPQTTNGIGESLNGQYVETTCTLKDFGDFVLEQLTERLIPRKPDAVVSFIFTLGQTSRLIELPLSSSQGYLSSITPGASFNQRDFDRSRVLTQLILGNGEASFTVNIAELSPEEARKMYIDTLKKKIGSRVQLSVGNNVVQ